MGSKICDNYSGGFPMAVKGLKEFNYKVALHQEVKKLDISKIKGAKKYSLESE